MRAAVDADGLAVQQGQGLVRGHLDLGTGHHQGQAGQGSGGGGRGLVNGGPGLLSAGPAPGFQISRYGLIGSLGLVIGVLGGMKVRLGFVEVRQGIVQGRGLVVPHVESASQVLSSVVQNTFGQGLPDKGVRDQVGDVGVRQGDPGQGVRDLLFRVPREGGDLFLGGKLRRVFHGPHGVPACARGHVSPPHDPAFPVKIPVLVQPHPLKDVPRRVAAGFCPSGINIFPLEGFDDPRKGVHHGLLSPHRRFPPTHLLVRSVVPGQSLFVRGPGHVRVSLFLAKIGPSQVHWPAGGLRFPVDLFLDGLLGRVPLFLQCFGKGQAFAEVGEQKAPRDPSARRVRHAAQGVIRDVFVGLERHPALDLFSPVENIVQQRGPLPQGQVLPGHLPPIHGQAVPLKSRFLKTGGLARGVVLITALEHVAYGGAVLDAGVVRVQALGVSLVSGLHIGDHGFSRRCGGGRDLLPGGGAAPVVVRCADPARHGKAGVESAQVSGRGQHTRRQPLQGPAHGLLLDGPQQVLQGPRLKSPPRPRPVP